MKIRPMGAELFYAEGEPEGQTHTTVLNSAFRYFTKAPKKYELKHQPLIFMDRNVS
jgi:hypothetical protein